MNSQPEPGTFYSNVSKILGLLRRGSGSRLLFCACENQALARAITRLIGDRLIFESKIKEIYLTFENRDDFLQRIRLSAKTSPAALFIHNLDTLVGFTRGEIVRGLNLARESLIGLDVPLVFWLTEEHVSLFANKAPDLFSRKDRGVISFSDIDLKEEMAAIEAAIAVQEKLRGKIPEDALKITLAALREQWNSFKKLASFPPAPKAIAGEAGVGSLGQGEAPVDGEAPTGAIITVEKGAFHTAIYTGPPSDDHDQALRIYRQVILRAGRHPPLRGLEPITGDPTIGWRRMDLARVYVQMTTKTRFSSVWCDGHRTRRMKALEAATANRRLMIIGPPGSGKTTFLDHLALYLAGCALEPSAGWKERVWDWPRDELEALPIRLSLRDFASSLPGDLAAATPSHLWNFIFGILKSQNLEFVARPLQYALEEGKAIMLLDGLDEIAVPEQRDFASDAVITFANKHHRSRVIITCRSIPYQARASRFTDFPNFELAHFGSWQRYLFIHGWFSELARFGEIKNALDENRTASRMMFEIRDSELAKLASNPSILNLIVMVQEERGRLPETRSMLYEEAVDILLWRWDQIKAGAEKTLPRLEELLSDADRTKVDLKIVLRCLAFEALREARSEGGETLADIKEWRLGKFLAELHSSHNLDWAHQVINTLKRRTGLLLEEKPGLYSFPQRTIQEYLAGSHLAAAPDFTPRAVRLAEDGPFWWNVLLLAVGRLVHIVEDADTPLDLVSELCPREIVYQEETWRKTCLAGQILLEVGEDRVNVSTLGRDLLGRVQRRLIELIDEKFLSPGELDAASEVLDRLEDF